VVAHFDPPDAQSQYREWRQKHAASLSAAPDDAIRIDTGRAMDGGDFVRVSVDEAYADSFASTPD
jgi:hypothetical protein